MLLTAENDMALQKNRHHFSKEEVFSPAHTSHIVPIGSPLAVWNVKHDDIKIAHMLYF